MFLVNLSLAELLGLFGAVSGLVVALYLMDRSRRRQVVATLRFWVAAERPVESRRRRRIRQWPSLLLQLVAVSCLLLAVAQLRWGEPDRSSRDHVLVLDTSSWMAARNGRGVLMDQARAAALAWVRALPAADRVLILHADALATPTTPFTDDRQTAVEAIRRGRPGASALRLGEALATAERLQRLHARRPGDIVLAGGSRVVAEDDGAQKNPPANLRLLSLDGDPENVGIRRLALRRMPGQADLWRIHLAMRNYGRQARTVDVALQFGGAPAGSRRLRLAPGAEQEAAFDYRTRSAGWLEARLRPGDAFSPDDRVVVELPALRPVRIALCSAEPDLFRPLFDANPVLETTVLPPARCVPDQQPAIMILDRVAPPVIPLVPLLWIEPQADRAMVRIRSRSASGRIERWRAGHPLAYGLRVQDLAIAAAQVFEPAPDDEAVAEIAAGPVILTRSAASGRGRQVIFGFHPLRDPLRFQVTTPLLFANALQWLAPGSFQFDEIQAAGAGTVIAALEQGADAASVRVVAEDGRQLPFTVDQGRVRFFAGAPGRVRVIAAGRESAFSLDLPEVGETLWQPPANVRRGPGGPVSAGGATTDLWSTLAILGGVLLLTEWLLYGRLREGMRRSPSLSRVMRLRMPWRSRRLPRPARRAS